MLMKNFLKRLEYFDEKEIDTVIERSTLKLVPAKTQLFMAGQPFLKLWYIEKGMVRAYRIVEGKDFTFFFFPARNFASDYQSFLTEQESPLFFESLTEVQYREFSKSTIQYLYKSNPRYEHLGRIMAERAYLSATDRLKQFQTEPLEERYRKLLQQAPELFQQIPQYHIASYLGVSPQSLSRIRSKPSNTKQG